MANHKSALKRIRQNQKRKLHNHYYAKTMRNALRDLRNTTEEEHHPLEEGCQPEVRCRQVDCKTVRSTSSPLT